ncbi:MAG: DoxX family membrane protein [Ignavibacteriales bacterium]|nr:DoxX family membrane protein [Ignavibacteriales bacterium]
MKAGILPFLIAVIRIILGVVFSLSGIIKLLNPTNFYNSLRGFNVLPEPLVVPFALMISTVELLAGVMMVAGLWIKFASFVISILLLVFIAAIIPIIISGDIVGCGCFGSIVEEKVDVYLILRDVIFLIFSLVVYQDINQKMSVDKIVSRRRSDVQE